MVNIVDKFISEKRDKSIILEMYENGLKQPEIIKFIIEKFKPFFQSHNLIAEQVLAYLPQYIDALINHLAIPTTRKMVIECLNIYKKAKATNPTKCFKSFKFWQDELLGSTSKIISLVSLDQDRSEMSLHEFAEDVFTKIGKIIEACIKPFLKILLYMNKLIDEREISDLEIDRLSLGKIVDELTKYSDLMDILIPSSFSLKLNDWRNIPKHDNFTVQEEKIICKYKFPPNEKEIALLKPELWFLFDKISDIYSVLRLTHSIFFFDNINEIQPYWDNKELREESGLLSLIQLFTTYGISVKSYSIDDNQIKFDLYEKSKSIDFNKSVDKILFLLRPIWYKSRKKYILIDYYNAQEILTLRIEADTSKRTDIFVLEAEEELITNENLRECCSIKILSGN